MSSNVNKFTLGRLYEDQMDSNAQGIDKRHEEFVKQRSLEQLSNFQIGPNPIYLYKNNELVQDLLKM